MAQKEPVGEPGHSLLELAVGAVNRKEPIQPGPRPRDTECLSWDRVMAPPDFRLRLKEPRDTAHHLMLELRGLLESSLGSYPLHAGSSPAPATSLKGEVMRLGMWIEMEDEEVEEILERMSFLPTGEVFTLSLSADVKDEEFAILRANLKLKKDCYVEAIFKEVDDDRPPLKGQSWS